MYQSRSAAGLPHTAPVATVGASGAPGAASGRAAAGPSSPGGSSPGSSPTHSSKLATLRLVATSHRGAAGSVQSVLATHCTHSNATHSGASAPQSSSVVQSATSTWRVNAPTVGGGVPRFAESTTT